MRGVIGIVLLDYTELLLRIFDNQHLIYSDSMDLSTFNKNDPLNPVEVINFFIEFIMIGASYKVSDWKFVVRNLPDELIDKIFSDTPIVPEVLTIKSEQDLICQALVYN